MTYEAKNSIAERASVVRVRELDWDQRMQDLAKAGSVVLQQLLPGQECRALTALYPNDNLFRTQVVMARHGFGRGEYKYFRYPLPESIAELRTNLYQRLVTVANEWNALMGIETRYPATHREFLQRCHDAGQAKPTPLLLRYAEGDYNCLH
jgi:hypothetical protein